MANTHFYQTHPDVLNAFIGSDTVKINHQPHGVFHPKAYFLLGLIKLGTINRPRWLNLPLTELLNLKLTPVVLYVILHIIGLDTNYHIGIYDTMTISLQIKFIRKIVKDTYYAYVPILKKIVIF